VPKRELLSRATVLAARWLPRWPEPLGAAALNALRQNRPSPCAFSVWPMASSASGTRTGGAFCRPTEPGRSRERSPSLCLLATQHTRPPTRGVALHFAQARHRSLSRNRTPLDIESDHQAVMFRLRSAPSSLVASLRPPARLAALTAPRHSSNRRLPDGRGVAHVIRSSDSAFTERASARSR